MPRTKKPAGAAVDSRNGRRAEISAAGKRLDLAEPEGLCAEAAEQWRAYWEDAAATVQTPADRGVVLRWIDAVNRYLRLIAEADLQPLVAGSTGQLTENPLYKVADKALGVIERCEKQLGIGALNRSGLGIAVIAERKSLADMNARYGGGRRDEDAEPSEPEDPRLRVIPGEVV
jgi:P27 family predicted phage terminase small subunit